MSTEGKGGVPPPPVYDDRPLCRQRSRSGIIFVIIALALLLAIGFFFLVERHRDDARGAAATQAAEAIDNAARSVGDAASRTFDRLRNEGRKRERPKDDPGDR